MSLYKVYITYPSGLKQPKTCPWVAAPRAFSVTYVMLRSKYTWTRGDEQIIIVLSAWCPTHLTRNGHNASLCTGKMLCYSFKKAIWGYVLSNQIKYDFCLCTDSYLTNKTYLRKIRQKSHHVWRWHPLFVPDPDLIESHYYVGVYCEV